MDASHKYEGGKIAELSKEVHACNVKNDSLYDELEELTDTFAEEEAKIDQS